MKFHSPSASSTRARELLCRLACAGAIKKHCCAQHLGLTVLLRSLADIGALITLPALAGKFPTKFTGVRGARHTISFVFVVVFVSAVALTDFVAMVLRAILPEQSRASGEEGDKAERDRADPS